MAKMQEGENNGFEIEINAPYSLNYLIFVQNIFLNSKAGEKEKTLFPYLDSSTWGLLEKDFEKDFKEVWEEAVNRNSHSGLYDHNGILEVDKALYSKLFMNSEAGKFGYSESVKSFLAWWDGIHGKIAIEKVFDEERIQKVYKELSASITANKRLKINLIYDRLFLSSQLERPWYAVLTIEEVFLKSFLHSKRPDIISVLLKCCK